MVQGWLTQRRHQRLTLIFKLFLQQHPPFKFYSTHTLKSHKFCANQYFVVKLTVLSYVIFVQTITYWNLMFFLWLHSCMLYIGSGISIFANTLVLYFTLSEKSEVFANYKVLLYFNCVADYFCSFVQLICDPVSYLSINCSKTV